MEKKNESALPTIKDQLKSPRFHIFILSGMRVGQAMAQVSHVTVKVMQELYMDRDESMNNGELSETFKEYVKWDKNSVTIIHKVDSATLNSLASEKPTILFHDTVWIDSIAVHALTAVAFFPGMFPDERSSDYPLY